MVNTHTCKYKGTIFVSRGQLRYEPTECKNELASEWTKLGQLFLEDADWCEPEEAQQVCPAWLQQFSVKNPAGTVLMPARVRYPGKAWILKVKQVLGTRGPGAGAQPGSEESIKEGPLANVTEFVVRLRGGSFRLVGLDKDKAKVSDVDLPGPTSTDEDFMYQVVDVEGEFYFTQGGDADLISCVDYTVDQTPSLKTSNGLPGASPVGLVV